jgi:hypothetical protein
LSATGHDAPGNQPTEEELRAAYEAEIKRIRVEQVLLEQVVTLVNLGMRRTGIAPGTESERDPGQVRVAIEGIRALMPLVEQVAAAQAGPIRDALSQLQLAYVKIGGQAPDAAGEAPAGAGAAPQGAPDPGPGPGPGASADAAPPQPSSEPQDPKPGEPGPAQRSGRLWVPGQ